MNTVLVVDDDEMVRDIFARYLREKYPETYALARAEDAEALLLDMPEAERNETLVLMDVNLHPGNRYEDGCAAGRTLARRFPGVRFLFMSGHDQAAMTYRCPGLPPYVMKPISGDDLVIIVGLVFRTPPWTPPSEEAEYHRDLRHRRGHDT